MQIVGAMAFGIVTGWVTYRTIRRSTTSGLSDIATVVGIIGGAAITGLFPATTDLFGAYGIGLAVGFFLYLLTAVVIARQTNNLAAVNEWLGASPVAPGGQVVAAPANPAAAAQVPPIPPR